MAKKFRGHLKKMIAKPENPVVYEQEWDGDDFIWNDLLGQEIRMQFLEEIRCIRCGRITRKSYHQGYCYPCYKTAPQTADCILHPERCMAHKGIARDLEWSEKNCLQDHFVYLTQTSNIKVGVTRGSQVPTRWLDQGAVAAVRIAKLPNRNRAGELEVALKKYIADKTNWRNMLKETPIEEKLLEAERKNILPKISKDFSDYLIEDDTIQHFNYPVEKYPEKVKPINLEKDKQMKAKLMGIKGQYLIFDEGLVLNVRRHNGYLVEIEV